MKLRLFIILLFRIVNTDVCYADETNLYDFKWLDPDKEVFVLQKKVFKKKNTFNVEVGYIIGQSSAFQDTSGGLVRAGYYFHENHYIEGFFYTYSSEDNDSLSNIRRINQSTPFLRKIKNNKGINYGWTPFYGKINTFNKIYYFDLDFKLGLGLLETESNAKTVTSPTTSENFEKEDYIAVNTAAKLKFYVNERLNLSLEYNRANFQAPGPSFNGRTGTKSWKSHSDIMFSIGVSF